MQKNQQHKESAARVSKVFSTMNPYAVACVIGLSGPVTFSLDSDRKVWKEEELPRVGTMVILSDFRKNDNGWRAYNARFLRPEDEGQIANEATKKGP